ncbi:hypothetical protein ACWDYH_38905 [Nocardia goodfellowii]
MTARAYAATGQRRECLALLDRLAKPHGAPSTPDESFAYFYDEALALSTFGMCLLVLGETAAAIEALSDGMDGIGPEFTRNRAFTALDIATAHLKDSDVDAAAAATRTAAELTATNRSPRLVAELTNVRTEMQRWSASSPVRELDATLQRYRFPVPTGRT